MSPSRSRRAFLGAVATASVAGCLGTPDFGTQPETESTTPPTNPGEATGPPTTNVERPLPMPPPELSERAVSGGPPKDGIPAIDDPAFVPSDASNWLDDEEPVFGVATAETAKAYPQSILVWHEICNDVIDDTPVSVTYCPLTGTVLGFERGETTFGVSGRVLNNNLIMYDRATERWWPQVLATSIPGPWNDDPTSESLREFRVIWTTWGQWRRAHPETQVLSRDTGFAKNYDDDPYGAYGPRNGYYLPGAPPMFEAWSEDDRLVPKRVVIGVRTTAGAYAVDKRALEAEKLISGTIGETTILAVYDPALSTGYVYEHPGEQAFEYEKGQVVDGDGKTYAPGAVPLSRLHAFDAMWFAWSGFYPETTLYA